MSSRRPSSRVIAAECDEQDLCHRAELGLEELPRRDGVITSPMRHHRWDRQSVANFAIRQMRRGRGKAAE